MHSGGFLIITRHAHKQSTHSVERLSEVQEQKAIARATGTATFLEDFHEVRCKNNRNMQPPPFGPTIRMSVIRFQVPAQLCSG